MGLSISDLDDLMGYDPVTHSAKGFPSLAGAPAGMGLDAPAPNLQRPQATTAELPGLAQASGRTPKQEGQYQFKAGMPQVEAPPLTPGYFREKQAQQDYGTSHPWGSPISEHPGFAGKVGHALSVAGNIAGNVLAPAETSLVPGSDLNKQKESQRNLAGEVATEKPDIAEQEGEIKEAVARDNADAAQRRVETQQAGADTRATAGNAKDEDIADKGNLTKTKISGDENATREDIANKGIYSREKVAKLHDDTEKLIAQEREAGANERAAIAQDPNKLTNTMKTMKQQAQTTLPEIDKALTETAQVKDLLGPSAGRWNDFIQGKIGISDPRFAHYRDEISLVSTAVTLAHARGRMSGELYNHFQQMFDAGKQDPDNMVQALDVAKEWLSDYASMGDTPGTAAGGGTPAPAGGVPSFSDWSKGKK